jgi:hypothetical protein
MGEEWQPCAIQLVYKESSNLSVISRETDSGIKKLKRLTLVFRKHSNHSANRNLCLLQKFTGSLDRMVTILFPSSSFNFGARCCSHKIRSVVFFNERILRSGTQNQ